ncbi:MAG: HEAT repeat domain-containing protein [Myxococcaceae bacterium]|nr:HEAT repeat domain-containing protein [Myxococcaceae bacterium]MCI0671991.1 HEAT repeat domain-containing protein [Myxococcaceae bacterium]
MGRLVTGLLLAMVVTVGCKRGEVRHTVERVEASGARFADSRLLGVTDDEVASLLTQALRTEGHFELPGAASQEEPPEDAVRVRVQLAFAREVEVGPPAGRAVQVGLTLVVRRREKGMARHEELDVLAQEPIHGEVEDAARRALLTGLRQVSQRAHLALAATHKSDSTLVDELGSPSAPVREAALHALVARRHPKALPALLKALEGAGPLEVRRCIGALVELGDPQAVPALIELVKGRDPGFMTELLFALAAIGGPEAEAYLFTVAQGHDLESIRTVAQQALGEVSARERRAEAERNERPSSGR